MVQLRYEAQTYCTSPYDNFEQRASEASQKKKAITDQRDCFPRFRYCRAAPDLSAAIAVIVLGMVLLFQSMNVALQYSDLLYEAGQRIRWTLRTLVEG